MKTAHVLPGEDLTVLAVVKGGLDTPDAISCAIRIESRGGLVRVSWDGHVLFETKGANVLVPA